MNRFGRAQWRRSSARCERREALTVTVQRGGPKPLRRWFLQHTAWRVVVLSVTCNFAELTKRVAFHDSVGCQQRLNTIAFSSGRLQWRCQQAFDSVALEILNSKSIVKRLRGKWATASSPSMLKSILKLETELTQSCNNMKLTLRLPKCKYTSLEPIRP